MRYNGVYDAMTFPPYVFKEYPKVVHLSGGKTVIAESQADELRAMANDTSDVPVSLETAANAALADKDQEIADLKARLAKLSVKAVAATEIAKDVPISGSVVNGNATAPAISLTLTPKPKVTT